jgi:hypothetical protein
LKLYSREEDQKRNRLCSDNEKVEGMAQQRDKTYIIET